MADTTLVWTDEACPDCGQAAVVETVASQDGCSEGDWCAYDGDELTCPGCGRRALFSADEDGGWANWDDCGADDA